ncbi:MAG: hypothetical protein HC876_20795 [Chloroflexaceae bacterium]|nr:hypothetical protein [Chloroflexaceae bacterium]
MDKSFAAAQLDPYAERITTGIAYLGGLLLLPLLFAYLANLRWGGLLIPSAVALLLAIFLLLTYANQPRNYRIIERNLVIQRRLLPAIKIPLKNITGVSFASALADMPRKGVRFAFNPGVFGYQGPFYLDPFGQAFLLATHREKLVALARYPATSLIISPDNPRTFVAILTEYLEELHEEQGTTEQVPDTVPRRKSAV